MNRDTLDILKSDDPLLDQELRDLEDIAEIAAGAGQMAFVDDVHSETFLRIQADEQMRKALIEHDEREMLRWKVIKGIQRRRPDLKWSKDYSLPPLPLVAIRRPLEDQHV